MFWKAVSPKKKHGSGYTNFTLEIFLDSKIHQNALQFYSCKNLFKI
jgi:hypothetical protein